MKLLTLLLAITVVIAGCQNSYNHDGIYVAHVKGEYSIGDDTLIIDGDAVVKRTSYRKIHDGKLLPREFKVKSWNLRNVYAPPIRFAQDQAIIGSTTYKKQP